MKNEVSPDIDPEDSEPEAGTEGHGRRGPERAGQSGDSQGLSSEAESSEESVEELADEGQTLEAEVVFGVEDAADHPEQPVRSHEDERWVNRDPSER